MSVDASISRERAAREAHEADTTDVHGIPDTSQLATLDDLAGLGGGGGGAPSGPAGGVLAGTYPNPSFASAMATLAALNAEITARSDADTAEATTRSNADATLTTAAAAAQATANAALPKAGGTMTGAITLPGDPVGNLEAAPRQWVLAQIAALINSAPGALDTLGEIATRLSTDEGTVAALSAQIAGALFAANNLSDLVNATTARTNLGLGSAAVHPATDFDSAGAAAAAQAASQPVNARLAELAALNTNATVPEQVGGVWVARSMASLKADLALAKADVGLANVTNDAQLKAADLDNDVALAADSATKIPSQHAAKAYADSVRTAVRSPWEQLAVYTGRITSGAGASLRAFGSGGGTMGTAATAQSAGPILIPILAAEQVVSGLVCKLRVTIVLVVNAVAPAASFTLGLYPISSVAGGAGGVAYTSGAMVGNSTSIPTPAASSINHNEGAQFDLPADGVYWLLVANDAAPPTSSDVEITARLQRRFV